MESLEAEFAKAREAGAKVIEYRGQVVRRIYERRVVSGERIIVRRLSCIEAPLQGLILRCDKGVLRIAGQEMKEAVAWSDTAPEEFTVEIKTRATGGIFKAWNCWRLDRSTEAWVMNAGFLVSETGNTVKLSCSDGYGDVDFTNLVVELEFIAP